VFVSVTIAVVVVVVAVTMPKLLVIRAFAAVSVTARAGVSMFVVIMALCVDSKAFAVVLVCDSAVRAVLLATFRIVCMRHGGIHP
jgi:hypothetical protein